MPRYWVIAPAESKPTEVFDRIWQFDVANNLISIGWSQLGDVSQMSREELSAKVANVYPDKPLQTHGLYVNMIWAFYHEIAPGDHVIARRGRKTLAAVGAVVEPAFYSPGKCPLHGHPNFLRVSWQEQPKDKLFPGVVFPMPTLGELSEEQFRSFVQESGLQLPSNPVPDSVEDPSAFVLERYLEDFIVSNFENIFKGQLDIFVDSEGNDGQQYSTDIGPIDILAVDSNSNAFVVIELKKGRPSDQVVGQILRYMGWVKMNLCKNGQSVRGLVICSDPDPKLTYALEMTNNIEVRYYSISFKLREKPQP